MIIIGIAGKARSGKDTFAKMLQEELHYCIDATPRCHKDSLAAPIKSMIDALIDTIAPRRYYPFGKEEMLPGVDKSPRELYQSLGTEWGRTLLGDDVWFNLLIHRVSQLPQYPEIRYLIIPDIRFDNEAERCDFVIQMLRTDVPEVAEHVSEAGIHPGLIDHSISNNGSKEELEKKAYGMAAFIRGRVKPNEQED